MQDEGLSAVAMKLFAAHRVRATFEICGMPTMKWSR